MKQLCGVLVLLVLTSAAVFTQMESELDLLGFSDDGAYVAFQLSSYDDGSAGSSFIDSVLSRARTTE